MLTKNKKTVVIIVLTISTLLIDLIPLMLLREFMNSSDEWYPSSIFRLTIKMGFFFWGWLPILCLSGYAFKQIRNWNVFSKFLKVTVIIVLLMSVLFALLWLLGLLFFPSIPLG